MSAVPKMEVRSILLRAPSPLETLNDTKKELNTRNMKFDNYLQSKLLPSWPFLVKGNIF